MFGGFSFFAMTRGLTLTTTAVTIGGIEYRSREQPEFATREVKPAPVRCARTYREKAEACISKGHRIVHTPVPPSRAGATSGSEDPT